MQVEIVEIAPMRLHSVLHSGPVVEIPQAWRRLEAWLSAHGLGDQVELALGLCERAPNEAGEIVYRAGVVLRGEDAASDGVEIVEAPGGRYACYRHVGPHAQIAEAFQKLYRGRLPASGHQLGDRPALDICRSDPRVTPEPELVTDLLAPIR
jgi:AraC family transcriptional regulator